MSEEQNIDMQELARHLRCPEGETGITVAEMMNLTNRNMITKTIHTLSFKGEDMVLEIGPGNGEHVTDVVAMSDNMGYHGIDISQTMVQQARSNNTATPFASFLRYNGKEIPFADAEFDMAFTVNTIYFWDAPEAYCKELARVLKPEAQFSIGFIPKRIMEQLPFTQYGFTLYNENDVEALMGGAGFSLQETINEKEKVPGLSGNETEREFSILKLIKK